MGLEFVQNQDTHKPFPRSLHITETIMKTGLENGLILRGRFGTGTGLDGDHILISPPFIITESECDELVSKLELTLKQVKQSLNLVVCTQTKSNCRIFFRNSKKFISMVQKVNAT